MEHSEIIETITHSLRENPTVRALFLSGSYNTGLADEYSDGPSDEVAALWHKSISQTGETEHPGRSLSMPSPTIGRASMRWS